MKKRIVLPALSTLSFVANLNLSPLMNQEPFSVLNQASADVYHSAYMTTTPTKVMGVYRHENVVVVTPQRGFFKRAYLELVITKLMAGENESNDYCAKEAKMKYVSYMRLIDINTNEILQETDRTAFDEDTDLIIKPGERVFTNFEKLTGTGWKSCSGTGNYLLTDDNFKTIVYKPYDYIKSNPNMTFYDFDTSYVSIGNKNVFWSSISFSRIK